MGTTELQAIQTLYLGNKTKVFDEHFSFMLADVEFCARFHQNFKNTLVTCCLKSTNNLFQTFLLNVFFTILVQKTIFYFEYCYLNGMSKFLMGS